MTTYKLVIEDAHGRVMSSTKSFPSKDQASAYGDKLIDEGKAEKTKVYKVTKYV
jgi:hypothetical protein